MSSFYRYTKHPRTNRWENACWLDDYYGNHHYGVKFENDEMYDPWKVNLIQDINEEEANILNEFQEKTTRVP